MPLANGEPVSLLDAIEAHADRLDGVRVHQMHALHDRPYLHGRSATGCGTSRTSCPTSPGRAPRRDDRPRAEQLQRDAQHPASARRDPLVLAARRLPDRHGYFSLGVNADYVASFIGRARFFLEANAQMPRTFGRNQIHVSQVLGWVEVDRPLVEVAAAAAGEIDDRRIAALVAERIPDRATIQTGIGAIPNAILSACRSSRSRRAHRADLRRRDGPRRAGVVNGVAKQLNRTKTVGTFALGTRRLYDFLDENAAFELWPVRYVNDPRVIAQEADFVSINSTIAVDLLGQCASETVNGSYYSSSGGQADFARGAMYSTGGQGFVVLHSTAKDGTISKIVPQLAAGDVVTTLKNTVDKVVTRGGHPCSQGRCCAKGRGALIAIPIPTIRIT